MTSYEISDELKSILKKLQKRDKTKYEAVIKKIEEIVNSSDPHHYKNLRYDMKDSKRVHVGHFVLIFRVAKDKIYFDDYDHHDKVY